MKEYLNISIFLILLELNPVGAFIYSSMYSIYNASKLFVLHAVNTTLDDVVELSRIRREMNARKGR